MNRKAPSHTVCADSGGWRTSSAVIVAGLALACANYDAKSAEFIAGVDVSGLAALEQHGAVYTDNGEPRDVIEMFSDHGVNWYRLRLFVDPNGQNLVVNDLQYTIDLAKRAKAAGGKLLLDLHYSDTWADPGRQDKPAAWADLDYQQLQQQVHDYTKEVVEAFKAEDVLPGMVQIGNEISSGLLWNPNPNRAGPNSGYPWTGGTHAEGFDRLAGLLTAGINGARDAAPGQEP